MAQVSRVLFYLIAIWCIATGFRSQTISSAEDLPWIADAMAGSNLEAFNAILSIWAGWVGMLLITAAVALLIVLTRLPVNKNSLLIAGVLSIGAVTAQSYSVLSLGAYGPVTYALYCTPVLAILATILGFFTLKNESDT